LCARTPFFFGVLIVILNDARLRQIVDDGGIVAPDGTPLPDVQAASVDLHLGRGMEVFAPSVTHLSLHEEPDMSRKLPHCISDGREIYQLMPGEFCLATTSQLLNVPLDMAVVVSGCSSIGRKGLVIHVTAGFVDPGFCGSITLELANLTRKPFYLAEGERICQLVFNQLIAPSEGYKGRYQNQRGTTGARRLTANGLQS
jgi:dCTP deaminase